MQLGLLDDAARLFKESGRFDYLNRLYQSAGIWNKAIKVGAISFHFSALIYSVRAVQKKRKDISKVAFMTWDMNLYSSLRRKTLSLKYVHTHSNTNIHAIPLNRWPRAAIGFI